MSYRAPLRYNVLSVKGKLQFVLHECRARSTSPRLLTKNHPTFGLEILSLEVKGWLNERRSRPIRIWAHEIEFQTPEEAIEFKMRWS